MAEKVIGIKVKLEGTEAQNKSLIQLEKNLQELTSERKKLNKEIGKSTKLTNEQAKKRAALNVKLKQTRSELLKTRQEVLGMDSFTTKLGKSFSKLGTTISGAFVGLFALQKVFEIGQAAAQLIIELDELTVGVQRLGNVSEETAKKTSASILAISSTFEASTSEILTAANAVSSQFGITLDEAVEKIKTGFAAGSNASGEFLAVLKEYPALLKEVGLDANQTFALINQQVTQGVYSDKGVDAIKEAGLKLRELPKATKEALDGIGLSSKEIEKALASGSKTIFQVVQDVSKKLGELPPQSAAVGTAIADIFGGAGEDAGLQFLTTLDDINLSYDDIVSNIDEYGQSQLDLVNAQEGFNSLINEFFGGSSVGFNQIKAIAIELFTTHLRNLFNVISGIRDRFVDLFNSSEAFRQVVFGVKSAFSALFNAIATPLNVLVSTIQTVVEAFSFLIDGEFSKAGEAFVGGFKRTAKIVVDEAKNVVNTFVENSEEASKAIIKIQTAEEKAIIESKKRQAVQNQQLAQQRALDAAKKAAEVKKAEDKAIKQKERAVKTAKRDADRKAKVEAREKEKALSNEERFLDKVDQLRIQSNLAAITDEKKLQFEKLRLKREALKQEAKDSILSKEKLNSALAQIDESFDTQEAQINATFEQTKKENKKQAAVDAALFAIDTSKQLIDSIANLEISAEQRKFERGLITEEEFALAKYKIEKKAFNAQKKADIASAIINGAVAVSKAFAQGGVLGFATSALLVAQTGAQVAAISKQQFPSSGFADGGYTGSGFGSPDSSGFKQAGVVHEGEYVVPKNVLESQRGSHLVGALESMRMNKPTPLSNIGFANGGFTSGNNLDLSDMESRISNAVISSIGAIKVQNVATDTTTEAVKVNNIMSEATFG
tara:strand:+ start:3009 stop:5684 length:2676 start_codon:yes stop_codon:yes gene_type:complete